eukprot:4379368-Heterocapsa_arctica.AAC.1
MAGLELMGNVCHWHFTVRRSVPLTRKMTGDVCASDRLHTVKTEDFKCSKGRIERAPIAGSSVWFGAVPRGLPWSSSHPFGSCVSVRFRFPSCKSRGLPATRPPATSSSCRRSSAR